MSVDARRGDKSVMDFFDVSRTNTAGSYFNQKLVRADVRDRDSFKAQVVDAAINNGAHGLRNIEHGDEVKEKGKRKKQKQVANRIRLMSPVANPVCS